MTVVRYAQIAVAASVATAALAPGWPAPQRAGEGEHMKKSVTYLYLLKDTPFFTRLDKAQLKWVIAHSTEWEAQAGMEVSNRAGADAYLWVLLDGGWQVEQGGHAYAAGHADAAKWYGGPQAGLLPADSRLVANRHSYVMRIRRDDMQEMQRQGFDFAEHMAQGAAFYLQHQ
jgi:hypothetical protein